MGRVMLGRPPGVVLLGCVAFGRVMFEQLAGGTVIFTVIFTVAFGLTVILRVGVEPGGMTVILAVVLVAGVELVVAFLVILTVTF